MRLAITGASGFIGGAVVRALVERGDEVWAWSRRRVSLVPDDRQVIGDLFDADVGRRLPSVDAFLHFAGIASPGAALANPPEALRVNALGTACVFEFARARGAAVVFASSVYAYDGTTDFPWREDLPLQPRSPLGASKVAAEATARSYWECFRVPSVALRLFTVYGPGARETQFVPAAFRKLATADEAAEFGAPDSTRDFLYIDDAVEGSIAALAFVEREPGFHTFNLAEGKERSIEEVVDAMRTIVGRPGLRVRYGRTPPRADEPAGRSRHWASVERAERVLGWRPRVSFQEGLRRTYAVLAPAMRR